MDEEGLPGKDYRPLTYFKNTKTGKYEWRWCAPSIPRPLYNLDKISNNPKATVVITEASTLTKSDPLFTKITDPFDVCLTLRQPPGNDFG
jgi:hypothetical protein